MNRFALGLACCGTMMTIGFFVGCQNKSETTTADATKEITTANDDRGSKDMSCSGCTDAACRDCNVSKLAVVKAPPLVDVPRENEIDKPTHRQSTVIVPTLDGSPIKLNTFCLDLNGTILAACGGKQSSYVVKEDGEYEPVTLDQDSVLLRLSSTGEELERWTLPFKPTAVDTAPNGDIFVAGVGEIARISGGKIVGKGVAPHMGDIEAFTAKAVEQAKRQAQQYSEMFDEQIEQLKERIAKIEAVEEEDRSRIQKAQLDAFQRQVETFASVGQQQQEAVDPEAVVASAKEITSIAASDQDIFWVCRNIEGSGYTIWRTDHQFSGGVEVVSSINGCCGQMDIQCCDGNLVIAENTSYKVGIYNRDGESVKNFGSRDRTSKQGFGSCCNPMNVCPLPDGTILTAESSIGHIKRFDQQGNFLDYVGKAKVAGGCKHCALGYDSNSDQYYMMHEDESAILVLSNQSTLPAETEDEKLAAKLISEFSARFLGTWEVDKKDSNPSDSEQEADADAEDDVAFGFSPDSFMFEKMTFHPDGKLEVVGGMFGNMEQSWAWIPKKGEQNQLTVSVVGDQVEMMSLTFGFLADNHAKITLSGMGQPLERNATRTSDCDGQPCGEKCEEEPASETKSPSK